MRTPHGLIIRVHAANIGRTTDDDCGGGDGIEWLVELAQSGNVVLMGSGDKECTP